jgi:hypothetical protein
MHLHIAEWLHMLSEYKMLHSHTSVDQSSPPLKPQANQLHHQLQQEVEAKTNVDGVRRMLPVWVFRVGCGSHDACVCQYDY